MPDAHARVQRSGLRMLLETGLETFVETGRAPPARARRALLVRLAQRDATLHE